MSDTPRTDAEEGETNIHGCVVAEFARTLERELAVVDAQLGQCKKMLTARDAEVERLREALDLAADKLDYASDMLEEAEYPVGAQTIGRAVNDAHAALAQPKEPT